MSEERSHDSEEPGEESSLDASFKVDQSSLSEEELGFAQALGFGEEGNEGADPVAEAATAAAAAPTPATKAPETLAPEGAADPPPDAVQEADAGTERGDVAPEPDAEAADDANAAPTPEDAARDWEEIHPRPAAESMQDELTARADEVLANEQTGGAAPGIDAGLLSALEQELADARAARRSAEEALAEARREFDGLRPSAGSDRAEAQTAEAGPDPEQAAEHEKQLEALRSELETASIERDHAIDQLATTRARLAEVEDRAEQLATSLRSMRGALIPLPEGERALRAEVVGLRRRLDEAAEENVRLAAEAASVATQLAIATARVEDRQHEVDHHLDRVETLERTLEEQQAELDEAIRQQRDAVALAARLQSENDELRSTQAALEETVQARDMEITAREEHLRVTRDGLQARDARILELNDRLGEARRRIEQLESAAAHAELDRTSMQDRIARRETRIAALTETLARIEEAMGRPLPTASPEDDAADADPEAD